MTLAASFLRTPLAHRGLHDESAGVIENSARAFTAAISQGYGVELDVQLTADGKAVVFHDDHLARLTDRAEKTRDLSSAELSAITLSGSQDTIQTLPEILSLIGGRVPILIEIKDQDSSMGPKMGPFRTGGR